ncbi:MAG: aminodeoxychorismate lyase [Candidatus Dadabacteria bacterium]
MSMKEFVSIDGQRIEEGFPLRSLFYGEGVFETFRWKTAPPVFWDRHLLRMRMGAESLGIPFPGIGDIERIIESAVFDSQIPDAYVKICLLSQGSSVFYEIPQGASILIVIRQYQTSDGLIKAHVSSLRRSSTSPILRMKSLNYLENILARREARGLGFDEAVFLNEKGEITEGSASNIFWLKDGVLFTPSPECGLLSGVIRGVVIGIAEEIGIGFEEGHFDLDSLTSSQCAFFTNSLIGAISISQIDGLELRSDSRDFNRIKAALLERLVW